MLQRKNEDVSVLRTPLLDADGRRIYSYETYRDYSDYIVCGPNIEPIGLEPHFHQTLEFLYVERGVLHHEIDGARYELTPGQLAIVPSFAMHAASCDDSTRRILLMVPPTRLGNIADLLDHRTFAQTILTDDADATLHGMLLQIIRAKRRQGIYAGLRNESPEHKVVQQALAGAFLHTVIARTGLCEVSRSSNLIIEALKYIHLHFREPIRIPDMARSLFCEQSVLSADFTAVVGMSLCAYINHCRAVNVRLQLSEHPEMTLEEASALAGFGSVRSMLRAYRQEYGCTPAQNR